MSGKKKKKCRLLNGRTSIVGYHYDCCNSKVRCAICWALSQEQQQQQQIASKFLNLPKCKVICLPATHIRLYLSLLLSHAFLLPRMPVLSINILYNPHDIHMYVCMYYVSYVSIFALITLHSFGVVFPSVCCLKLIKTDPGRQRPAASSLNTRTHTWLSAPLWVCVWGCVGVREYSHVSVSVSVSLTLIVDD